MITVLRVRVRVLSEGRPLCSRAIILMSGRVLRLSSAFKLAVVGAGELDFKFAHTGSGTAMGRVANLKHSDDYQARNLHGSVLEPWQ